MHSKNMALMRQHHAPAQQQHGINDWQQLSPAQPSNGPTSAEQQDRKHIAEQL